MAILGTLVDKQTISIAGSANDSMQVSYYNHSLPATNPELVLPNIRSIGAAGAFLKANGLPQVCAIAANASMASIGVIAASSPSVAPVCYDLFCIVFHTTMR